MSWTVDAPCAHAYVVCATKTKTAAARYGRAMRPRYYSKAHDAQRLSLRRKPAHARKNAIFRLLRRSNAGPLRPSQPFVDVLPADDTVGHADDAGRGAVVHQHVPVGRPDQLGLRCAV